jgi:hypothetical protein
MFGLWTAGRFGFGVPTLSVATGPVRLEPGSCEIDRFGAKPGTWLGRSQLPP